MRQQSNQLLTLAPLSTGTVLCVDLDGTLVSTDTLLESILGLIKRDPWAIFWLFVWVWKGRAYLKRRVAERVEFDPAELPYNAELLSFLEAERASGTPIVLTTGADELIANSIADHLQLFDEVLASDGLVNLTGRHKKTVLEARFGAHGFRYIGNSRADLPVWRSSAEAIVCGASNPLVRRLERERIRTGRIFPRQKNTASLIVNALRVYQWPKNLLIFLPLFLSHRFTQPALIVKTVIATVAFCCCASALYLANDLLDLAADRAHPRKRMRPFAGGQLSLATGIVLVPLCAASAFLLGSLLDLDFVLILAAYAITSAAYSFHFKEAPLLDVCLLGGLYVVRIFAGGAATGIHISSWTLGYSMFLFLSLALLKRYVELLMLQTSKQTAARGRGYLTTDLPILACFGAGAGCVAALLLALYIESPEVRLLYRHPERLWLLCGLHIYWISRMWLLANRGDMHHDPVLFALRDRASYWLGLAAGVVALLAT